MSCEAMVGLCVKVKAREEKGPMNSRYKNYQLVGVAFAFGFLAVYVSIVKGHDGATTKLTFPISEFGVCSCGFLVYPP